MGLYIPVIMTQSEYALNGKILLLSIAGVGDARLLLRKIFFFNLELLNRCPTIHSRRVFDEINKMNYLTEK